MNLFSPSILIAIIAAYLIGSIPVGVIVGRIRGFDPRTVGSGNIGMSNVARVGGAGAAAITFAGDMLKGLIPVIVARAAGFDWTASSIVGLAAFLGSIFSVFLRFRGGKGVSASLGIFLGLAWKAVAIAVMIWAFVVAVRRVTSLAAIAAAIVLPVAAVALHYPQPVLAVSLIVSALVLIRHRENIGRLLRGEEQPFRVAKKSAS